MRRSRSACCSTKPKALRTAARRGARVPRPARRGLRAEEEQVLRQPIGDIGVAALQQAQLRQQARRESLAVDVGRAGRCPAPRRRRRRAARTWHLRMRRAGAEAGADLLMLRRRGERRVPRISASSWPSSSACDRRHRPGAARRRVVGTVAPVPVDGPQVGRVHAVGPGQLLHGAVLREHRQRRDQLAGQQARQVVEQRERAALDGRRRRRRQRRGLATAALHRGLGGAQHIAGGRQADQLERADALVHLRTRVRSTPGSTVSTSEPP